MAQRQLAATGALGLGLLFASASTCVYEVSDIVGPGCDAPPGACTYCDNLCDPELGCIDCLTDNDCDDADSHCYRGECFRCVIDDHCDLGQVCELDVDAHHATCEASCEVVTRCSAANCDADGHCVACSPDDPCESPRVCDPSGNCVDCVEDADCGDSAVPRCSPKFRCVQCLLEGDCGPSEVCVDNECRTPCCTPDDCSEDLPGCSKKGVCSECSTAADCTDPALPKCSNASKCVACKAATDCPDETLPACSAAGSCVQCATSADCESPLPFCDQDACVECRTSEDCPETTPVCRENGCSTF